MDVGIISVGLPTLGFVIWKIADMNKQAQFKLDQSRKAYEVTFPRGTSEQMIVSFLSQLGGGLRRPHQHLIPTIVSEVRWTSKDVRHIIRVAPQNCSHVLGMIDAHIPGASVNEVELPHFSPTLAVDVSMTDTSRMLRINKRDNIETLAVSILHSFQDGLRAGEVVSYQLVLAHTTGVKLPLPNSPKSKVTARDYLIGNVVADRFEITDRQKKAIEPNFNVAIRIGVQAESDVRAKMLIGNVLHKLRNAESNEVKLRAKLVRKGLDPLLNLAPTPNKKSAQLTVTELSALMAPPIGDPAVPGLSQGATRRIAATEAVARDGRLLGQSNVSHRPVALAYGDEGTPYKFVTQNAIYIGGIGSGKSVGMANNFYDDVSRGFGAIVIDASGSDSAQSLYSRARQYIPEDRIKDVLDIHVRDNAENPVAFDVFKQGLGLGVIDQIVNIFAGLYPEIESKGVTVRELLHHGLWTLVQGNMNLVDLESLLRPKPDETAWARRVVGSVSDPELKDFWDRMKASGWLATEPSKRMRWDSYTDPLYRRLWQLTERPEIRHMVGQSVREGEGLNWERALLHNKIVLISLAGLPPKTAQLLGTLLLGTLWTTAQHFDDQTLRKPNALYLDEFQISASIRDMLEDILARGRKHLLPVTLGTQYITGLPKDIQTAVFNNVMTRVIYPLKSIDEATAWRRNMGTDKLTEWDFQNGEPYNPIVQLPTANGQQIVTVTALPPRPATGTGQEVIATSRSRYGTPVGDVRDRIAARRYTAPPEASQGADEKKVGPTPYDMSVDDFNGLGRSS
jgi:hypothetical protein